MAAQDEEPHSPIVTRVLDEYLAVLNDDPSFDEIDVSRLDLLLRKSKAPKPAEIDNALNVPIGDMAS